LITNKLNNFSFVLHLTEMNCPICKHSDISELSIKCPECGSDLAQLTMIDQLEEKYVSDVKRRVALEGEQVFLKKAYEQEIAGYRRRTNRLIILLLLFPLLFKLCKKEKPVLTDQQAKIESLQQEINQMHRDKVALQHEISSLSTALESCRATQVRSVNYTIKEGDRLSELGLLFFNNMKAGYQIGNDNNIWSDYTETHLKKGRVLKINFR
jgi:cell division protein FtsB